MKIEKIKNEELIEEMKNITAHMRKFYSLKYSFFRGILYGIGFLLGTTIIAGILLTWTTKVFDEIPFQEAIENKILNQ